MESQGSVVLRRCSRRDWNKQEEEGGNKINPLRFICSRNSSAEVISLVRGCALLFCLYKCWLHSSLCAPNAHTCMERSIRYHFSQKALAEAHTRVLYVWCLISYLHRHTKYMSIGTVMINISRRCRSPPAAHLTVSGCKGNLINFPPGTAGLLHGQGWCIALDIHFSSSLAIFALFGRLIEVR